MSRLSELLDQYCPDGVEYKPLWQLTSWDKRFKEVDKRKQTQIDKYHYYLAAELEAIVSENGDIKILTTNKTDLYTTKELAGKNIAEAEIVCIPWGGNPIVQYYNGKFVTGDNRIARVLDAHVLNAKYLYYAMNNQIDTIASFYRGSGIKHPSMASVLDLEIPIPPLSVQEEIVFVLDKITGLKDELETEFVLRKRQYEFYRDKLLSLVNYDGEIFEDSLGAITSVGTGTKPKQIIETSTEYDYINAGTTRSGYCSSYNRDGDVTTTPSRGQGGIGFVGYQDKKFWLGPLCYAIRSNNTNIILNKYIYYWLSSHNSLILQLKNEGGTPAVNKGDLESIVITYPSIEEQTRIISILDKFEELICNVSDGLPAEIKMRLQQYEYYRNKLLTFE